VNYNKTKFRKDARAWLVSLRSDSCLAQYYYKAAKSSKELSELFCRVAFDTFVKTTCLHVGEMTSSLVFSRFSSSSTFLLRFSRDQNHDCRSLRETRVQKGFVASRAMTKETVFIQNISITRKLHLREALKVASHESLPNPLFYDNPFSLGAFTTRLLYISCVK